MKRIGKGGKVLFLVMALILAVGLTLSVAGPAAAAVTPAPNPPLSDACGYDIVLVMDESGSISNSELNQMKAAFSGFVDALLPGTPTEFALVDFGTLAVVRGPFTGGFTSNFTSDASQIKSAINGPRISGGTQYTNWQQALLLAHSVLPNRPDHPDLVIFASDGNPNRTGNPAQSVSESAAVSAAVVEANALKTTTPAGVSIITIGIGDQLKVNNLIAISSADACYTTDFEDLAQTLANLACALCGGTINVHKVMTDQGDPSGWTFKSDVVSGGSSDPTQGDTDQDGWVSFSISISGSPGSTATVDMVETLDSNYYVSNAVCSGATNNGTFDGVDSIDGIVISKNQIVTCKFYNTPNMYYLTVEVAEGSGDVDGGGFYDYGQTAYISATPSDCYDFDHWVGDDVGNSEDPSTTVFIDGDKTVQAYFVEKGPYDLTVDASPPEGGSVTGAGSYACGSYAPITATPDECYEFTGWEGDGITNPNGNETTVLIDETKTVIAHFGYIGACSLTVSTADSNGSTDPSGTNSYSCGQDVQVTAYPNDCYEFDYWSGNVPEGHSEDNPILIHVSGNKLITANFVKQGPYSLTVNADEGGTVTFDPANTGPYECGTFVTITACPDECYEFTGWEGDYDGNPQVYTLIDGNGDCDEITVLMNQDRTITAHFEKKSYMLSVSSEGCCSVELGDTSIDLPYFDESVDCGTEVTLTAYEDGDCCQFDYWRINDNPEEIGVREITFIMDSNYYAVVYCSEAPEPEPEPGPYSYPQLLSITVKPADASILVGGTQQFTATAKYSNDDEYDVTNLATWASGNVSIATVSSSGLATGEYPGETSITASLTEGSETKTGSATLTVTAPQAIVERIVVEPESASILVGDTQPFTATAYYEGDPVGVDVTNTATWDSSEPDVASVASGLATGLAPGVTDITAELDGMTSNEAELTVTTPAPTLLEIVVEPDSASILVGGAQQFTATAYYSSGDPVDVTGTATWASSESGVASVASGLATGVAAGITDITAELDGMTSNKAELTVTTPTVERIVVEPGDSTLPVGGTQPFTATAYYSDGSSKDVTDEVTWSSSDDSVVSIDENGLGTGEKGGDAEITASLGDTSDSVPVSVTPSVPWSMIGWIIAAALAAGLLFFFLMRRRKKGEPNEGAAA